MWKCPVCKTNYATTLCDECGFDGSMDYERHPTLGMVSENAVSVRCKLYAASKRPFIKCANCANTYFRVDAERFEMQCIHCGNVQPVPQKVVPVENRIEQQPDSQAVGSKTNILRLDGLYQSKGAGYTSYLRFFSDGVVVEVGSIGTASDVIKCLNHSYENRGKYRVKGNNISFSIKSSSGTVDYNGNVTPNGLELAVHSHINGKKFTKNYKFVSI